MSASRDCTGDRHGMKAKFLTDCQMQYMNPKIQSPKKIFSLLLLVVALLSTGCEEELKSQESSQGTAKPIVEQAQDVPIPLVVSVIFRIKPSKRDLFLRVALAAIEPTRKEPGSISYSFYEDASEPNTFIYYEEWKSEEALASHLAQPYTQAVLSIFNEVLDGEPIVRMYDVRGVSYELIEPKKDQ